MGIFSAIKNRIFHREEDYDDVKSHVLGETLPPPPPLQEEPQFDERFGPTFEKETFPREPEFPELRREEPLTLERELKQPSRNFEKDYDILDKLNLIEAQLSAIRSQTETINERLKNLEARLVRRF